MDVMDKGKRLRAETLTAVGEGNDIAESIARLINGYVTDEQKQDLKAFTDDGMNVDYIASHSVFYVYEKYRNILFKHINNKSKSILEDELLFEAAWVKICVRGWDVDDENQGEDINL